MLVQDKLGKMLVSFCPGDAVGLYSEGEEKIKNIALALGDYSDRVFDMYFEFSDLADRGFLFRKEYGNLKGAVTVSFFYTSNSMLKLQRQRVINYLLNAYLQSCLYPREGKYVVKDHYNNCKLISNKKKIVGNFGLTQLSQGLI